MIDVWFADLHKVLFLGGKNHGEKLDSYRFPDLKMQYDKKEKELVVSWKGATTHIPSTNIACYEPGLPKDRGIAQLASPMIANISGTAQVETPFGHVHAGPGKGKTK